MTHGWSDEELNRKSSDTPESGLIEGLKIAAIAFAVGLVMYWLVRLGT